MKEDGLVAIFHSLSGFLGPLSRSQHPVVDGCHVVVETPQASQEDGPCPLMGGDGRKHQNPEG